MSACVSFNLLTKFGNIDKMRGFSCILSPFRKVFSKSNCKFK